MCFNDNRPRGEPPPRQSASVEGGQGGASAGEPRGTNAPPRRQRALKPGTATPGTRSRPAWRRPSGRAQRRARSRGRGRR
eukprot:9253149-Alexandrium_andersonii.AAC.1